MTSLVVYWPGSELTDDGRREGQKRAGKILIDALESMSPYAGAEAVEYVLNECNKYSVGEPGEGGLYLQDPGGAPDRITLITRAGMSQNLFCDLQSGETVKLQVEIDGAKKSNGMPRPVKKMTIVLPEQRSGLEGDDSYLRKSVDDIAAILQEASEPKLKADRYLFSSLTFRRCD